MRIVLTMAACLGLLLAILPADAPAQDTEIGALRAELEALAVKKRVGLASRCRRHACPKSLWSLVAIA